jgi:hypothetical protein
MLRPFIICISVLLLSCNASKNNLDTNKKKMTDCPDDVDCFVEVLDNKTMALFEDTTGALYIKMEDKEGSRVVKHVYRYEGSPMIADDGYEEVVYFELDATTEKLEVKDKSLSNHKLIVQKSCFCTDAGYETIQEGKLVYSKTKTGFDVKISYNSTKKLKLYDLEFSYNHRK